MILKGNILGRHYSHPQSKGKTQHQNPESGHTWGEIF
jgi:hypothetical protein